MAGGEASGRQVTTERVDAVLVAGGRYHDIDFARAELLKLLAEHPHVRTTVAPDFSDRDAIAAADFLVTYTCDVRPSEAEQSVLGGLLLSERSISVPARGESDREGRR